MFNGDGLYEYDRQTRTYTFPDTLNFEKEPYATIIPGRAGSAFKVHKSEGLANSALSHHHQGAKYKQEDGKWVKVWEFYEPVDCESCHLPLDPDRDKAGSYHKEWLRSPLHRGSALFAPFLCLNCYKSENEVIEDRERTKQWRAEQKRRREFDASMNKNN